MNRKEKKGVMVTFSLIYLVMIGFSIAFLVLKKYGFLMVISMPSLFMVPVFLTFYLVPKETNHHKFLLVLSILLRYGLVFCAIYLPGYLWFHVAWIQDGVPSYTLLFPGLEILIVYVIIVVLFLVLGKDEDKARKQSKP